MAYLLARLTSAGYPNFRSGRRSTSRSTASPTTISVGSVKLRTLASKGLTVKVPCAAACTAAGTMTADKATARRPGTKKVASGKGRATKAGTAKATLKTSRKVARKLKRLRSAKVTIKVTIAPKGGAKQTVSRKLTLKR